MDKQMKIDSKLKNMYDDYYGESEILSKKRALASKDTASNIIKLFNRINLANTVDVGAGNGSVINELSKQKLYDSITALEISESGIKEIKNRNIHNMLEVKQFDGYIIPYEKDKFDTGLCIHVLEHVEHERIFLQELSRVSKKTYIEVPLEGGD